MEETPAQNLVLFSWNDPVKYYVKLCTLKCKVCWRGLSYNIPERVDHTSAYQSNYYLFLCFCLAYDNPHSFWMTQIPSTRFHIYSFSVASILTWWAFIQNVAFRQLVPQTTPKRRQNYFKSLGCTMLTTLKWFQCFTEEKVIDPKQYWNPLKG